MLRRNLATMINAPYRNGTGAAEGHDPRRAASIVAAFTRWARKMPDPLPVGRSYLHRGAPCAAIPSSTRGARFPASACVIFLSGSGRCAGAFIALRPPRTAQVEPSPRCWIPAHTDPPRSPRVPGARMRPAGHRSPSRRTAAAIRRVRWSVPRTATGAALIVEDVDVRELGVGNEEPVVGIAGHVLGLPMSP